MKIVIIGNCQARPIAILLKEKIHSLELINVGIVHLIKESQELEYLQYFESADLILTQPIYDAFKYKFFETDFIKSLYRKKTLLWPNLHYKGYNPEIFYLRDATNKIIAGPLGDYHDTRIFECWKSCLSIDACVDLLLDFDYNEKLFKDFDKNSLKEMSYREENCDVVASHMIEMKRGEQKLFHTFNHPSNYLLRFIADEIVKILGHNISGSKNNTPVKEMLGQISLPTNVGMLSNNASSELGDKYKGFKFDGLVFKGEQQYTVSNLVSIFYELYDGKSSLLQLKP
jgi:hypothetical protein